MESGRNGCAHAFALVALALLLLTAAGAGAAPFAYVPGSGSPDLSVIDTATDTVVATIALPAPATGVAVDRAGQRVYLAGGSLLTIVDAATNSVVASVPIGSALGVAVNPAGTRAYVTRAGAALPIVVVDTATATVVDSIPMPFTVFQTSGIEFDPSGRMLYVAKMEASFATGAPNGAVMFIDPETNQLVAGVGFRALWPNGIAVSADGSRLYVACPGWGRPRDADRGVEAIDIARRTVVGSFSTLTDVLSRVGTPPYAVAVDPAGRRVYVATDDGLWAYDAATTATLARAPGSSLRGVTVHPDGTRVYATNVVTDSLNVYDAATLKLLGSVPVGTRPVALGRFIGPAPAAPPPPAQPIGPTDIPAMGSTTLAATALVVALIGIAAVGRYDRNRRR